jgi:hypothetical protein
MEPRQDHSQLSGIFEEGWYSRLKNDPVYAGIGANYYGYSTYIGSMAMYNGVTTATPYRDQDQAQPEADSKIARAADEVGATGDSMGGTYLGL